MDSEIRDGKIIINKCGGNASKGSITHKLTIPNKWCKDMGITQDNREVTLEYRDKEIIIRAKEI